MLREGSGEPLLLLHGVLCSERVWRDVVPILAPHYDVIAPTAIGHRGGAPALERPFRIEQVVHDAERVLDELGLDTAHVAGNSMGGWSALELARRGRARTVCAISPAGAWTLDSEDMHRVGEILTEAVQNTERGRALLPLMARSRRLRRWAMRYSMAHGGQLPPQDFVALAEDLLACEVSADLAGISDHLERLDPPPCPITLAWAAGDRLFPVDTYGAYMRKLVPGARFLVLPDTGHVPMLDAPRLVAETILETAAMGAPTPVEGEPVAA